MGFVLVLNACKLIYLHLSMNTIQMDGIRLIYVVHSHQVRSVTMKNVLEICDSQTEACGWDMDNYGDVLVLLFSYPSVPSFCLLIPYHVLAIFIWHSEFSWVSINNTFLLMG